MKIYPHIINEINNIKKSVKGGLWAVTDSLPMILGFFLGILLTAWFFPNLSTDPGSYFSGLCVGLCFGKLAMRDRFLVILNEIKNEDNNTAG